jgi:hypothetical protein
VIRLQSDLDPQGRMARILIAIDDPLQLDDLAGDQKADPRAGERGIPVLLDAYVNLDIHGRHTEQLVAVPRRAIRNGDQAFILADDDTLTIETIDIAARRPQTLLVRSGVQDGDQLIVSPIATPVEGMRLRTSDDQSESASDQPTDDGQSDTDDGGSQ